MNLLIYFIIMFVIDYYDYVSHNVVNTFTQSVNMVTSLFIVIQCNS